MLDGTKVTSKEDWEAKRKPELKALFQHYMYGRLPPPPDRKAFEVHGPRDCLGGKAELRDVTIYLHKDRVERPLHVILITPKGIKSPPVFIGMNFCGNHALLDDPKIPLPAGWVPQSLRGAVNERATDAGRGTQKETWNADLIIEPRLCPGELLSAATSIPIRQTWPTALARCSISPARPSRPTTTRRRSPCGPGAFIGWSIF